MKDFKPKFVEDNKQAWVVDVGIEFVNMENEKALLLWDSGSHPHIISKLFDISRDDAKQLVDSKSFFFDCFGGIATLGGCRAKIEPEFRGPYDVRYFQAYCTVKNQTSHIADWSNNLCPSSSQMYDTTPREDRPSAFDQIEQVTEQFIAKGINGNARPEGRVPYEFACQFTTNRRLMDEIKNNYIIVVKSKEYW